MRKIIFIRNTQNADRTENRLLKYMRGILIAICLLFLHPCSANYVADNIPTFGLSCATPDSIGTSQLDFYNTEVRHGYIAPQKKKLNYDDVYKIADMKRFPSEMLAKNNIRFNTKKINVANYGKCYYYILQFKQYPGVYLNGKITILYRPSNSEYFVFGESVSNISTEDNFLLITNNCRGNVTYDRFTYNKEMSRFLLECGNNKKINWADSIARHFEDNNVKEISFVMYNFTRDRIHRYGYVNLEGKINAKSMKLYLKELKTNDTNHKWTKYSFKTSPLLEDSLISLLDSQFVSNRIPFILKKEVLDLTRYEDLNCLSVWIKKKGRNEKHDFFFGDYSQTQVVSDTMITYSPQMIELFRLMETIIRNEINRKNNKNNY